MIFLWSRLLWLLLLLPMLTVLYFLLLRGKRPALRYPDLALLRGAVDKRALWRQHIPPCLFLCALLALIVAIARPAADMPLVVKDRTIILAIDVSHSMTATDIPPTRLWAAQAAARKFVRGLPRDVRVGIVTFAGNADIVQVPTRNRRHAINAIDSIQTDSATSIGTGIIASLVSLFPDAGLDAEYDIFGMGGMRDGGRSVDMSKPESSRKPAVDSNRAPPISAAAIILLTDGRNTMGKSPRAAAKMAVERGIPIYTVGFGTPNGKSLDDSGNLVEAALDEEALRDVAYATHGTYFNAASAERLDRIYAELDGQLVREFRQTEVTALFIAVAAILILVAAALSVAWFPRPGWHNRSLENSPEPQQRKTRGARR